MEEWVWSECREGEQQALGLSSLVSCELDQSASSRAVAFAAPSVLTGFPNAAEAAGKAEEEVENIEVCSGLGVGEQEQNPWELSGEIGEVESRWEGLDTAAAVDDQPREEWCLGRG